MLYIKFKIKDASKYSDFKRLYEHMVKIRQIDFQEEEESFLETPPKELAMEKYKKLIPDYANNFLERQVEAENKQFNLSYGFYPLSILNYLEYGFEVDMDELKLKNKKNGIVKFSTGNYPFGGINRFLMVLKAFDLIPTSCYDGFSTFQFKWISEFEYEDIELPKYKIVLENIRNKF